MCLCLWVRVSVCADMLQYILLRNKSVCSRNCHEKTHHWLRRMAAGHVRYRSSLIFFSSPLPFLPTPELLLFLHFSLLSSSSCPLIASSIFFPINSHSRSRHAVEGKVTQIQFIHLLMCEIEVLPLLIPPPFTESYICYHSDVGHITNYKFYSKRTSINDFLIPHFCHIANQ